VHLLHGPGSLGQRGAGIDGVAVDMNMDCTGQKEKLVRAFSDPSVKRKRLEESAIGLLETSGIDA
jgi:hypothetical protein